MKNITRYGFLIFTILLTISACSQSEEVIKIKDKNLSSMLFIQKVEDNSSNEEMTKVVKDKQKIEQILTMIEGLKVKDTNSEYVSDVMKSQNTYMFGFSEGEKMETGKKIPYAFYILENGTFIFPHNDFNALQEPRVTLEKHKELLDEIKNRLDIDF